MAKMSRWFLSKDNSASASYRTQDGQGWAIRRYERINGKTRWERLPRKLYDNTIRFERELSVLVEHLNKEHMTELERAREAYQIKHKFITQVILDEYAAHVSEKGTSDVASRGIVNRTTENFLHFFVNKLKLNDPLDWFANQALWGAALTNKKPANITAEKWESIRLLPEGEKWSAKTIRDLVMFSNRFYKWLHNRHPKLFPLLVFEPLTRAQLKLYDGNRTLDKREEPLGKFIPEKDWAVIAQKIDPELFPFLWLAYHFGLRRAETLAIRPTDIKTGYLHLARQLISMSPERDPQFGPLKSRHTRKVFYWFTTPAETFEVVSMIETRMHPATLSKAASAAIKKLGFDYKMHDFRRTFITRALRAGRSIAEVRDCAGHSSIETTNRYVMRDEEFDSDVFTPVPKPGKTS